MSKHCVPTSRPQPAPRPPAPDPLDLEWRALWAAKGAQMQRRAKEGIEQQRGRAKVQALPSPRTRRGQEARRLLVQQAVDMCRTVTDAWRATGLPKGTFYRYLAELRATDFIIAALGENHD